MGEGGSSGLLTVEEWRGVYSPAREVSRLREEPPLPPLCQQATFGAVVNTKCP